MPTIEKRGDSYRITVSAGYNADGTQQRKRMTWKPPQNMTARQIEKELTRQATLFEERCKTGEVTSGNIKFQPFAEAWLVSAEKRLKERTITEYQKMTPRIYAALGAKRIDRITPQNIQMFIDNLSECGINKQKGKVNAPLSPKTIRNYIGFISTVLDDAVKNGMIVNNPCRRVTLPPMTAPTRNHDILTVEEAAHFLELLENEPPQYRMFFNLAIFTGMRRGELLGLEWSDIDFEACTIDVNRTSQYTRRSSVYTDTPKTENSVRVIKITQRLCDMLQAYKQIQNKQRSDLGDQWHDCGRLFTRWNGEPLFPTSPLNWLYRFCERTGMRQITIHSLRHLHASLLINAGTDVATVSSVLGHSTPTVTLNTYTHEFSSAKAKAAQAVADALTLHTTDKK